jgi:hypothetical protein
MREKKTFSASKEIMGQRCLFFLFSPFFLFYLYFCGQTEGSGRTSSEDLTQLDWKNNVMKYNSFIERDNTVYCFGHPIGLDLPKMLSPTETEKSVLSYLYFRSWEPQVNAINIRRPFFFFFFFTKQANDDSIFRASTIMSAMTSQANYGIFDG